MLRFVFIPLFRIGARIRKQDNDENKIQIINSTTDTNVTNLSQTGGTCSVNNTLDTGCSLPKACCRSGNVKCSQTSVNQETVK